MGLRSKTDAVKKRKRDGFRKQGDRCVEGARGMG